MRNRRKGARFAVEDPLYGLFIIRTGGKPSIANAVLQVLWLSGEVRVGACHDQVRPEDRPEVRSVEHLLCCHAGQV